MNSESTRNRILATARGMFHARSYADVGIQEICEAAQALKGSFYHFFPSKRELALTVIEDMAQEWAQGFVGEAFDANLTPMQRLDCLVDGAYFWQKSAKDLEGRMPGCLFGNLALEMSTRDDILRAKLDAVFDRALGRFRETLEEAVRLGELAPLDCSRTATAMLAYLEGVILLAKTRNDPELVLQIGPAIKSLRVEQVH